VVPPSKNWAVVVTTAIHLSIITKSKDYEVTMVVWYLTVHIDPTTCVSYRRDVGI